MTEVTKEDREAAVIVYKELANCESSEKGFVRAENARRGHMDDLATVQAFARHREASTEALQSEVEALRAENARLRASIDSLTSWLLHRFGPNTPEGLEAQTARAALENRDG